MDYFQERLKQLEQAKRCLGDDVALVGGRRSLPRPADRNGVVTDCRASREQDVFVGPAGALVNGVMDDLAIHLRSIHVPPQGHVFEAGWLNGDVHAGPSYTLAAKSRSRRLKLVAWSQNGACPVFSMM